MEYAILTCTWPLQHMYVLFGYGILEQQIWEFKSSGDSPQQCSSAGWETTVRPQQYWKHDGNTVLAMSIMTLVAQRRWVE